MPGQGKYTVYAPPATAKNTLMNKLFKGNSTIENPLADLVGKENEARAKIVSIAKQYLTPDHTEGDPGLFPNGVNLDYSGDPNGVSAPDFTKVKWTNPGDPANGFTPDPTSPGPGSVDPMDKNVDPGISPQDIAGPGYVPGGPGTGTKSPTQTSKKVHDDTELGVQTKLAYDVHGFG